MTFEDVSHDIFNGRRAEITVLDVVRLRDALTHDGPVTFAEALALTALEGSSVAKCSGWKGLYIDALVAHAVSDTVPEGYVDAAKAERLLALAAPAGRVVTATIFEMLAAVIAAARWVPERLTGAVLDEVLLAVACGDGVLRPEGAEPGVITRHDVERVRRILYVAGGPGPGGLRAITAREATSLLAIDAAGAGQQDATWTDLFTAAMVDAALTASFMAGPQREVMLAPARLGVRNGQRLAARYRPLSIEEQAIAALERQRVAIITGDEPATFGAGELSAALALQPATPAMAALDAMLAEVGPLLHPELVRRERQGASVRAA